MRIEFRTCGSGTNIEVLLLEDLGGTESVVDRIHTAQNAGDIHYEQDRDIPVSARQLFEWVEDCWAPPVIGGRFGWLHPYWNERKEARRRREVHE
jgi:hypothetical protein